MVFLGHKNTILVLRSTQRSLGRRVCDGGLSRKRASVGNGRWQGPLGEHQPGDETDVL